MGAEHIEFVPSEPVDGVTRFFTTNGRVFFHEGCFYLSDSCLIVRIHADSWRGEHLGQPPGLYFSHVRVEGEELRKDIYKHFGPGETQSIPLADVPWRDGLGPASAGVFPSAFGPWVEDRRD